MRRERDRHDQHGGRMRGVWREWWGNVSGRWTHAMPKFFRVVFWVCSLVSGTALAVNTAIVAGGGMPHGWWQDIYPYLLGVPAGMAFAAKFTQTYGNDGKPVDYEDYRRQSKQGNTVLDKDDF